MLDYLNFKFIFYEFYNNSKVLALIFLEKSLNLKQKEE